ncbi:MAG TPA: GNAT family N-acetyltransferase [Rickettsiales bacterium]|nr:GNAT family N-acetyltransferase [Rickettsiales bacterium]
MANLTDPSIALRSFQEELLRGTVALKRGVVVPDLYIHWDEPNGEIRLTYVRLKDRTVTAIVIFARCEPIGGAPCFNIGYAVPEAYRNEGRAKEVVEAAISEMRYEAKQNGISTFYVEAIIGIDNKPSQRVAEQVISATPTAVTDHISKLPAFQYIRKIDIS